MINSGIPFSKCTLTTVRLLALVTAKVIDSISGENLTRITENISTFLLEQTDGVWKIKMMINNQNFPILNGKNIGEKFLMNNAPASRRFSLSTNIMYDFMCSMVDYNKRNGLSPEELGNIVGENYSKNWERSRTYDNLLIDFSNYVIGITTYVELVEKNDTTLVVKILPPSVSKAWKVTRNDMVSFTQNMWYQIARNMESDCTITDDGRYWTVVMNKK